mgnify:CR=1 FL=1
MSFGCRGSQKSSQLEESWQLLVALGGACEFCRFSGRHANESVVHFGHPFGTEIEKSGAEPVKKHAQHSKQRKVQFPMPFFVAHFVAQTVNTICFEGSAHVHLNGFGVALGCHLGSLFNNFAIKGPNLDVTRGAEKAFAKKRSKHELLRGSGLIVWVPKKE